MNWRIGFGFDVHPLAEGLPLVIGGVAIPHNKGAVGHSDADALTHALCDALLGAAHRGDIGTHFPPSDPTLKGIDSQILLRRTMDIIAGYSVVNVDATVCLERPKIRPWVEQMEKTLAASMGVAPDRVSIKATTTERLGFVGREEGVAAYATVLLEKTGSA